MNISPPLTVSGALERLVVVTSPEEGNAAAGGKLSEHVEGSGSALIGGDSPRFSHRAHTSSKNDEISLDLLSVAQRHTLAASICIGIDLFLKSTGLNVDTSLLVLTLHHLPDLFTKLKLEGDVVGRNKSDLCVLELGDVAGSSL